jgi:hypothetical protein
MRGAHAARTIGGTMLTPNTMSRADRVTWGAPLPIAMTMTMTMMLALAVAPASAQYKGDRVAGNIGLEAGSQAPPGIYAGYLLWVYPTDTFLDRNGDEISPDSGGLTSTMHNAVVSWVTPYKFAGANIGGAFVLPFVRNRIELGLADIDTGADLTDSVLTPLSLGWRGAGRDVLASYSVYMPTGRYEAGGRANTGLGMVGHEVAVAATFGGQPRLWHGAAGLAYEWHTKKKDQDIRVGQVATIEGGVGRTFYKKVNRPLPLMTTIGIAGYSQFKVTGDSGTGVPLIFRDVKDRVFALGPELKVFVPHVGLTLVGRVLPEFGARVRTRGTTVSIAAIIPLKVLGTR